MPKVRHPAMKLTATWTPSANGAGKIMDALVGESGLRVTGGKLHMAAAVECDLADPASVQRASAYYSGLKEDLQEAGRLHTFDVRAGTAFPNEIIRLNEPSAPAETGEASGAFADSA